MHARKILHVTLVYSEGDASMNTVDDVSQNHIDVQKTEEADSNTTVKYSWVGTYM